MRLDPENQQWMKHPGVQAVFGALPNNSTRFVGGCVRNALMGFPVKDIDLATQLPPQQVIKALEGRGIKTIPTGILHGTVTAVSQATTFEITTLRKDVSTDGRRAVVAFTQDWFEDAQRRDLTINALYADQMGQIYDPIGLGLADIEARRFRFVGEADTRIKEDYLRILRYFRFVAYYGHTAKLDAQALKACRENRAGIKDLSAERQWAETKNILRACDPHRAVHVMLTQDILNLVLPEASNVEGLEKYLSVEREYSLDIDPLRRLMSMAARDEIALMRLTQRLKCSNSETRRILAWAGSLEPITYDMEPDDQKRAIYRTGAEPIIDRAWLRLAGATDPSQRDGWHALIQTAQTWTPPEFPISGQDLKDQGMSDGPTIGRTLKALETLWIRSGFKTQKPQLLMAMNIIGLSK